MYLSFLETDLECTPKFKFNFGVNENSQHVSVFYTYTSFNIFKVLTNVPIYESRATNTTLFQKLSSSL